MPAQIYYSIIINTHNFVKVCTIAFVNRKLT